MSDAWAALSPLLIAVGLGVGLFYEEVVAPRRRRNQPPALLDMDPGPDPTSDRHQAFPDEAAP